MRGMKTNMPRIVYALQDPVTRQVRYVGVTGSIASRLNLHLTKPTPAMKTWLDTLDGVPPVMVGLEMLNEASPETISAAERKWIRHFQDAGADLVNVAEGGYSGFRVSDESRRKMSAAKAGRTLTPEHRARIGAASRGRRLSEEQKAKLSAARRGHVVSEETRAKLSEIARNRPHRKHTEESRAKMAEAKRQNWADPEFRARTSERIRAASCGRVLTPEHKLKMAEGRRRSSGGKIRLT